MLRARHWLLGVAVVACNAPPSRLDLDKDKPADKDPWAHPKRDKDKDKDDGLGGLDLQSILAKIKDSIEKPGPYEAPQKSADYTADKPHWGVMKLGGAIVEREAFSLTGGRGTELRTAIDRLRGLAKEPKLDGILVRFGALEISFPDLVELRGAMHDVRAAGKKLYCHAEDASNSTYLVLTACERIGLAPLGQIAITGPAAMPIHVKGLLDKLGVQADFVHIGAYKSAAEPLTNDAPSKQMLETLDAILDRRFDTMVSIIAKDRNLDPAAVKGLIDTALFRAEDAKQQKLVDDIASFEAFRDEVKAPWAKIKLDHEHDNQLQSMMKLARFVGAMPADRPVGPHVALVYALGNIVDGNGDGVLGARSQIASHTLVAALRALGADDSVKAVVLRIDSGGGSAQASELIWRAVAEVKAKKPVIVSMSDVAASGGYYIASGATKIYALDDTLTGSIGVVGGKIAPGAALANLGVKTYPMGRGKRATMMARLTPWTADEKAVIEASMKSVYTVFVGRVAEGRHKSAEDVDKIAAGRVWTGAKAKELGLVDEIGGLDAALADARKLGNVDAATDLEVYPPTPTLRDLLVGYGQVQAPLGVSVIEALREADPALADAATHILELALSFRTTAIQTVTILPEIR